MNYLFSKLTIILIMGLVSKALSQECSSKMNTHVWKSSDMTWLEVEITFQNQSDKPVFYYYFHDDSVIEQIDNDSIFLKYILLGRDFSQGNRKMRYRKQVSIDMTIADYCEYSNNGYNGYPLKVLMVKPGEVLVVTFRKPLLGLKKLRGRNILLSVTGHYFLKKEDETYFSLKGMNKHYYGDIYFFPYHREIDLSAKVRIK